MVQYIHEQESAYSLLGGDYYISGNMNNKQEHILITSNGSRFVPFVAHLKNRYRHIDYTEEAKEILQPAIIAHNSKTCVCSENYRCDAYLWFTGELPAKHIVEEHRNKRLLSGRFDSTSVAETL